MYIVRELYIASTTIHAGSVIHNKSPPHINKGMLRLFKSCPTLIVMLERAAISCAWPCKMDRVSFQPADATAGIAE